MAENIKQFAKFQQCFVAITWYQATDNSDISLILEPLFFYVILAIHVPQ